MPAGHPIPRIAITPGEPAGIGPDLMVQLAQRPHRAELVAIADPDLLEVRAFMMGLDVRIETFHIAAEPRPSEAGVIRVMPIASHTEVHAGRPDPASAQYVLTSLRRAVMGCRQGMFDAMVTGPVHKGVINDAGIPFTGHTEFLAQLTQTPRVVMMLATPGLRVALATTHLPLREVPDAITRDHLFEVLGILTQELQRRFGIAQPRILVAGLNPHAGEGGHLGREEIEVIEPVCEVLRNSGHAIVGPLPADTLFTPERLEEADAVLCMYHDQGLPVLKARGFGQSVNVTLGLPIVRTSVDHGTALELAGTGRARADSLTYAVEVALEMVGRGR